MSNIPTQTTENVLRELSTAYLLATKYPEYADVIASFFKDIDHNKLAIELDAIIQKVIQNINNTPKAVAQQESNKNTIDVSPKEGGIPYEDNTSNTEITAEQSGNIGNINSQIPDNTVRVCLETEALRPANFQNTLSAISNKDEMNVSNEKFSKELQKNIEMVKSGEYRPIAFDKDLERYVSEKNSDRCIGTFLSDIFWDGTSGWKNAHDFFCGISYLWNKYPDLFHAYNPGREEVRKFNENKSAWSQQYFSDQLNFARYNFSLERLCHLVLVYSYIYKDKIENDAPSVNIKKEIPSPSTSSQANSMNPNSANEEKKHPFCNASGGSNGSRARQRHNKLFYGIFPLVILLILVCFVTCRKTNEEGYTQINRTIPQQQQNANPKGNEMPIHGAELHNPGNELSIEGTRNLGDVAETNQDGSKNTEGKTQEEKIAQTQDNTSEAVSIEHDDANPSPKEASEPHTDDNLNTGDGIPQQQGELQ